jgi:hypothetical protein
MAKKLITHMVGSIGIILGLVAGYTIIQAELDLNPMSYAESYEGLIFYSYSACAIVSSPFLLMQHIIEHRKNSLLIFTVLGLQKGYAKPFEIEWKKEQTVEGEIVFKNGILESKKFIWGK